MVDVINTEPLPLEQNNNEENPSQFFDNKPGLILSTRPEIRKNCSWDISLKFSDEAINIFGLKQIFLEKPKNQNSIGTINHFLCLKVRSKLLNKELGFRKVADVENDKEYLELNDQGVGILKVKFTQRPRAIFHKHGDIIILVVSLRSSRDDRPLITEELELIFRGGTGSIHSADNRKKQIINTEIKKLEQDQPQPTIVVDGVSSLPSHLQHQQHLYIPSPQGGYVQVDAAMASQYNIVNNNNNSNKTTSSAPIPFNLSSQAVAPLSQLSSPQSEPLTAQLLENLLDDYEGSAVMSEFKDEMELYQLDWITQSTQQENTNNLLNALNQTQDGGSFILNTESDFPQENKFFSNFGDTNDYNNSSFNTQTQQSSQEHQQQHQHQLQQQPLPEGAVTRGRKRKLDELSVPQTTTTTTTTSGISIPMHGQPPMMSGMPSLKKPKYSLEDKFYQKLFFKSLSFMTLEELRSLCSMTPVPIFVKDDQSVYKWANHAFCSFILDTAENANLTNKRTGDILSQQEGEAAEQSDKYAMDRQGKIKEFNLHVHQKPVKVTKLFTQLRDGNKVLVGAVGTF